MIQQHIEELLQRLNKKFPSVENVWVRPVSPTSTVEEPKPIEVSRLAKENGELRESLRVMQEEMNRVLAEKCLLFDRLAVTQTFLDKIMRRAAGQT